MDTQDSRNRRPAGDDEGHRLLERFQRISHRILRSGNRAESIPSFVSEILKIFLESFPVDVAELEIKDGKRRSRWRGSWRDRRFFHFEILPRPGPRRDDPRGATGLRRIEDEMLSQPLAPALPYVTAMGSFWTGDAENLVLFSGPGGRGKRREHALRVEGDFKTLAVLPLKAGEGTVGLLTLKARARDAFAREDIEFLENVAQSVGILLANQKAHAALKERLKELTCLYGIASDVQRPGSTLEKILQGVVERLPPAWQYPDITSARILLDGRAFTTDAFSGDGARLKSPIEVGGVVRGGIEVVYEERRPEWDEGPFLKEERDLLDTVARQVALIIERRQAEEDKLVLQDQLRHADRLATIGQLAASIAHELNEPLSNVLGFGQLSLKDPGLPEQASRDVEKIIDASLHAREIVRKLLVFTRQVPHKKADLSLNDVVEDAVSLLEGRLRKSVIELDLDLATDLPRLNADPVQMNQVLVNLVVNALHAMPEGGHLRLSTVFDNDAVLLSVEDDGVGMEEAVRERIFEPFFTTKEVNEGTGLGLLVVQDIVRGYGGFIDVWSEPGRGCRFDIRFPTGEDAPQDPVPFSAPGGSPA